jgi:hypothetical protein
MTDSTKQHKEQLVLAFALGMATLFFIIRTIKA